MSKKIILFTIVIIVIITNFSYAQRWILAGTVLNPGNEPSISVVDEHNVWIAGGAPDTPRVFRTTNGGVEWLQVNTTGITKEVYCIWAVNPNTVFVAEGVVSGNAKLLKTTNAGETWTVVLQTGTNEGNFNCLIFSSIYPMVGAALADKIYFTTNGGNNWTVQSNVANSGSSHNSLMLIDENFYGFGLSYGTARVRVTTNGGNNWTTQNVNLNGSYTSGFAYKEDKLTGLASTSTSMPYIA